MGSEDEGRGDLFLYVHPECVSGILDAHGSETRFTNVLEKLPVNIQTCGRESIYFFIDLFLFLILALDVFLRRFSSGIEIIHRCHVSYK